MDNKANTIAMKVVKEFLGLEEWQRIPLHMLPLVESIEEALKDYGDDVRTETFLENEELF